MVGGWKTPSAPLSLELNLGWNGTMLSIGYRK